MALPPELENILSAAGIGSGGTPGATPSPTGGSISTPYAGQGVVPVPSGVVAPTNPIGTQYAAQQAEYDAKQREMQMTSQYYGAQEGLIPYSKAELDAKSEYNNARSAYLDEQLRASQAEKSELQGIQAAKKDTGDILATSMAQRERDVVSYRYNLAGLPTPIEIDLPPGHTGPLPAGTVARLKTIAQILEEASKDNAAMRKYNVEAARIASEIKGVAVSAAEIASGRVRLGIDEVELAMRRAGLDVEQATLNRQRTEEGPPGTVLDAEANEWVSPAVLRERQAQRSRALQDKLALDERGVSDLAPFAIDTLISYAAAGVLGDDWEAKVRAELTRRAPVEGYTPGFINIVVEAIRARQSDDEGDIEGPPIGGGRNTMIPGQGFSRPESVTNPPGLPPGVAIF